MLHPAAWVFLITALCQGLAYGWLIVFDDSTLLVRTCFAVLLGLADAFDNPPVANNWNCCFARLPFFLLGLLMWKTYDDFKSSFDLSGIIVLTISLIKAVGVFLTGIVKYKLVEVVAVPVHVLITRCQMRCSRVAGVDSRSLAPVDGA